MLKRLNFQYRPSHDLAKRQKTNQVFIRQGPGGRSSISGHTVTVFGCTGFLGRYVVNNLVRKGSTVVIPYRGTEDEKRHLKVMGDLGQIVPLSFDLRNEMEILECVRHSDVVYNLIGKDFQTKNFKFDGVHVAGAKSIAKISKEAGVSKFIHVSALNADRESLSQYLKSKALGEEAVLNEFPEATIVRPSYMYGHEDRFWNRIGFWSKWSPIGMPLVNQGRVCIRPVYVGDVAQVLAQMVEEERSSGRVVELFGPREYHYLSIINFFNDIAMREVPLTNLPKPIAKFLGHLIEKFTIMPMATKDEVERYYIDDHFSNDSLKFEDYGVQPLTVEETISRFVKLYQPEEVQNDSIEPNLKKYTTDDVRF